MIWRWFWREWRSPSLLIVWLSLTLAVACVLALGNISSKIEQTLNRQSRDFLAADKVLRSSHPVLTDWLNRAKQEGLTVSRQVSFMSMAYAGDRPLLSSVKAVDQLYPLYGELKTLPEGRKPQTGQILVAPRLLALLNVNVGDSLDVGDTTLTIIGELIQEPDAGFSPFNTSPRILMNIDDIDKTGAVQPGSRLTYRYLFAGQPPALTRFDEYLRPQLQPGQRLFGVEESGGSVGKSLQRAQQFLLLSALLTLLLSSAAVVIAMGHYCRSRYDLIAVLKTLGANRRSLRYLIIGQWFSVLCLAAITGTIIGLLFERLLIVLLQPVLPAELPESGLWPLLWSLGSLLFISLCVGIRPYKQLLATLPLRVLRRDSVANVWPLKIYLPVVVTLIVALLAYLVGFNAMWWSMLLGLLALVVILGVTGWSGLLLLRKMTTRNLAVRLAVNRLLRQPSGTISQLGAFSLSFMLLALLFNLRGGLLDRWQQQLPAESPNYFLMNIRDNQVAPIEQFLRQHDIEPTLFYPVVRVRLTDINDRQASDIIAKDQPGFEAIDRELNLTWLKDLPPSNALVSGVWPPAQGEVSIEQGVANRLKLKIGDKLTFTGNASDFSATISSIRRVDWESLRPNFYFIFPPKALDSQPQSWLTSFRYSGDAKTLVQLNRQFPTVTLLDVGNILRQVSQILEQVSRALEVMVGLVIVCGFLLLFAQVQVGMRQRRQELVVYRTLGAGHRLLRNTLLSEFALIGLATGVTATIGAEITLWLLQWKVFDFPWRPNLILWLLLPLICVGLLSLCGGGLGSRLFRQKGLYRRYNE
jgi:putative ABC transport system permease protein